MFGKPPPEEINPPMPELSEVIAPEGTGLAKNNDDTELTNSMKALKPDDRAETARVVEKISGILSPYFIVLVGLILYDENFLFGSILIVTGILSLLKVSRSDITDAIAKIKASFSSPDDGGTF